MSSDDPAVSVRALRDAIDDPEISDAEYDALVRDLTVLEEEHPDLVTPDSPTQRVGAAPSSLFAAVQHPSPMWSLDNAFSFEELVAWGKRVEKVLGGVADYWCELKVDGAAADLSYVEGRLSVAATRGDGRTGEDITVNVKAIPSVPLRLRTDDPPELLEVRGEIYMPTKAFAELNRGLEAEGERIFANPHNAAA